MEEAAGGRGMKSEETHRPSAASPRECLLRGRRKVSVLSYIIFHLEKEK